MPCTTEEPKPAPPKASQTDNEVKPERDTVEWAYQVVIGWGPQAFPDYITPEELKEAFKKSKKIDEELDPECRKLNPEFELNLPFWRRSFVYGDYLCETVRENVRMWAIYFHKQAALTPQNL